MARLEAVAVFVGVPHVEVPVAFAEVLEAPLVGALGAHLEEVASGAHPEGVVSGDLVGDSVAQGDFAGEEEGAVNLLLLMLVSAFSIISPTLPLRTKWLGVDNSLRDIKCKIFRATEFKTLLLPRCHSVH